MKLHPWNFQKFCYNLWQFQELCPRLAEITYDFFLFTTVNSFPEPLGFPHFIFSIPLEIPCSRPLPVCFFSWNSPFTQLHWQFLVAYIFPVSDEWLIFCCGNLILHQKKKWKRWKYKYLMQNKKIPKRYMYISIKHHSYLYWELASLTHDVTCLKL